MEVISGFYTCPKSKTFFAGAEPLYRVAHSYNPKITRAQVHQYLENTRAYTIHKPKRIHYKRLKTIPSGYFTDFQVC